MNTYYTMWLISSLWTVYVLPCIYKYIFGACLVYPFSVSNLSILNVPVHIQVLCEAAHILRSLWRILEHLLVDHYMKIWEVELFPLKAAGMPPLSSRTCAKIKSWTGLRRPIGNWEAYGRVRKIFFFSLPKSPNLRPITYSTAHFGTAACYGGKGER